MQQLDLLGQSPATRPMTRRPAHTSGRPSSGVDLKREGQKRALDNAGREWRDTVLVKLVELPAPGQVRADPAKVKAIFARLAERLGPSRVQRGRVFATAEEVAAAEREIKARQAEAGA